MNLQKIQKNFWTHLDNSNFINKINFIFYFCNKSPTRFTKYFLCGYSREM